MPKRTNSLFNIFTARSRELEKTRSKMEVLLDSGNIELNDIEQVYAGLYLDIYTEFESLIEELFIGLLSGRLYTNSYNIRRKVKISPVSMVQDVVFANKPYLDWLPYDSCTIPRANLFFELGEPFTLLPTKYKNDLDDYRIIRNVLAHKSASAIIKFQDMISGLPLLPQEKTPAGYLRSKPYSASDQTQLYLIFIEFEEMAKFLCL